MQKTAEKNSNNWELHKSTFNQTLRVEARLKWSTYKKDNFSDE